MKKVIIIHGWDGTPEDGWQPWLKKELEGKGYVVEVPAMPNAEKPEIKAWLSQLKKSVGKPNKDTYFIGHSMGVQTILHYLNTLPKGTLVGGAIFVAGFTSLKGIPKEEELVVKPWFTTPLDWKKINTHTSKFTSFFSDNDPWVSLSNVKVFEKKLGSKVIVKHNAGHFMDDDGLFEFPELLKEFNKIAK